MSFNQSGFNQTAFNRPTLLETLIAATMSGEGTWSMDAVAELTAKLTLDGVGLGVFNVAKIKYVELEEWEGIGGSVFPIGKSLTASATWQGVGTITISNESFLIFVMEFDGVLNVGERITLNTEKFTLKKDGADILPQLIGDFVDLKLGLNEVVIESDTGTRTLIVRVEHRDRWV